MTTLAQDLGGVVLLPCPFCGGQPKFGETNTGVPGMEDCGYAFVECCIVHAHSEESVEDAVEKWNTRAHSAEIAGALRDAESWRPIESAPNGAWFLVHSERGWIGLARRADPDYAPGEGWFEDEHTEYLNPAWLTHWRPLPAPPAQDSAMQQGGGGG